MILFASGLGLLVDINISPLLFDREVLVSYLKEALVIIFVGIVVVCVVFIVVTELSHFADVNRDRTKAKGIIVLVVIELNRYPHCN